MRLLDLKLTRLGVDRVKPWSLERNNLGLGLRGPDIRVLVVVGWWVAYRIIVSAPIPVPLCTLDFGFGTWICDLDFGLRTWTWA